MSVKADFKVCFVISVRRLRYGPLSAALCLLLWLPGACGQAVPASLSQRKINEMAAALESARLALIEDTGVRRPREPLPLYLDRLARPQTGETDAAYEARIQGYLDALTRTVAATTPARAAIEAHGIDPHNIDAPNLRSWQRASQALYLLPTRLDKLKRAWRKTHRHGVSARSSGLGAELAQTLELVLTAYSALRDVRP